MILYEQSEDICRDTHTPRVAVTSFFTGEVEIFDFVTERVKRCIAAKREVKGIDLENTQSEYLFINYMGFCLDILSAQRCWWGCKLH